ncbi:cell division protein ZapE [Rhabdaerophilum calidifontis]|uniref:cell division protein ZapE n=1 Tax=Rhabdaerophilum calidifontis TaxID=2604328 RepID=UPI00123BBE91|nr:cell division protein ZapE [Rhabdaerophilum calidifontis]
MSGAIASRYAGMVAEGRLEADPAQRQVVAALDQLAQRLEAHRLARKGSALGWLFGRREPEAPIRGIYLWGSVGRGKTMLADLFHESLGVKRKRRAHFHAFMADVHARIHDWRQRARRGEIKGEDPIRPVAEALADEAWVLVFDEFAVTDIADAMILGRLFQALFARGVVIVATSNVEPARLYENGLNRALFLPFIGLIEARMQVIRLDARTDYRLEKLAGRPVYYAPADVAAAAVLDRLFEEIAAGQPAQPRDIDLGGRALRLPRAAAGVARASFEDLCAQPLGAVDYLALARNFHTLVLDDVPRLDFSRRNETKRFITLIDILYEHHVKLIVSAAAEPAGLYMASRGHEAFEFDRTVSRLIEMRSEAYLALPHGRPDSQASGDSTGLVET